MMRKAGGRNNRNRTSELGKKRKENKVNGEDERKTGDTNFLSRKYRRAARLFS